MDEVAVTIDVSDAAAMLGAATSHQEFKWTRESCLLLLHEYEMLKDKFKDRKNKKKDLWAEISMKFKKIYACDLEWDVAYKKFRNLKQTFEQVRVKLSQQALLGQVSNRPKWPYYDKFVQILDDPAEAYSFNAEQQHQLQVVEQQLQQQPADQVDHHGQLVVEHQHQQQVEVDHHHLHHHHHHLHHHHPHAPLDPASVGQVIGAEEFTAEALASAFTMGEELEIPSHPPDTPPDEVTKTEDDGTVAVVGPLPHVTEQGYEEGEPGEEEEDEEVGDEGEEAQDEMEPPHRKRYRRRTINYQQERLAIEREKLHTLREIQRGIECKNDILQGILQVLQAKVWQVHPTNE